MKNLKQIGKVFYLSIVINSLLILCLYADDNKPTADKEKPRIVNIINFIRLLEPRDAKITETVLYETVVKQVEIMKKYNLRSTFLLQYDALMDPRYQDLLKSIPAGSFEIGAWWEIPQPLVENAGMKWRGRYPWDWHADVGFSTGYTPEEREKLVDVYMADFKKIYGSYPKSVGSWFIDAHTLNYMYQKYKIVASCNCKDQIGTDGYTLWGGYWNQAYYPSLKNAYMPAQHEENQIPVPIFRMLGSDAIRQYDAGLGSNRQGVITLEPVYKDGGGDEAWVNWYFKQFVEGEPMAYAYVQAGQENSFTWDAMAKGFEIQMPLIAQLRDEKKIQVETLSESGQWFKEQYRVTPATSVTVNDDLESSDLKTVWFNSRFYRANLYWEKGTFRFRDIHLFNENVASRYLDKVTTSNECVFFTLPFVDGHRWSTPVQIAGLRFRAVINGKEVLVEGGDPAITSVKPGILNISWPLKSIKGTFIMELDEKQIEMKLEGAGSAAWFLELTTDAGARLPFQQIGSSRIDCTFEGMNYGVTASKGAFSIPSEKVVFRITPQKNTILLNLAGEHVQK